MRLQKLNGWQRLWILASVIYLAFAMFIAIVDFPPEKICELPMREYDMDGLVRDPDFQDRPWSDRHAILKEADPSGYGTLDSNRQANLLRDMKNEPWWQGGANNKKQNSQTYTSKPSYRIEDNLNRVICDPLFQSLPRKRFLFIGTMILIWIIPCLAIYVLGLSLHWVYRGFRKVE